TFAAQSSASTGTLTVYQDVLTASFNATPNPASCTQSISFDGSGSSEGDPRRTIVTYAWDFGDSHTSSGSSSSTTHSYAAFGSYTATLTLTDSLGRNASVNHSITVSQGNQAPTVNTFTAGTASAPSSFTIYYSNASTGDSLVLNATATDPDTSCGDSV